MFEPKCEWWDTIAWEDKTVLLKGILSIKREDYGRFVELALDAGMREALAGDYDVESQSGEFWFDAEKEGPRGILNWLGFSVEDETEEGIDFVFFEDCGIAAYRDDMGRAVFEACAPVIGAGSVLVFMENWDEAEEKDPRIWRHTFCTEMAKAGMNPKALQYIMGHKDIKMTLGYYAHMDGCTAAEEMRRVAA